MNSIPCLANLNLILSRSASRESYLSAPTAIGTLELLADLIIVTNYDGIANTLEHNHTGLRAPQQELGSRNRSGQMHWDGDASTISLVQSSWHQRLSANGSYTGALTPRDKLINDTLLAIKPPMANDNDIYPPRPDKTAAERFLMKSPANNFAAQQKLSTSLFSLFLLSMPSPVLAIRLLQLEAPRSVQEGNNLKLRCLYDSKGDKLSSLSWHKDGKEFYRYQAFERKQPVLAFNLSGINVDPSRSRNNTVILTRVTRETSGRYKCEVTTGFPSFQVDSLEMFITVTSADRSRSCRMASHSFLVHMLTLVVSILVMKYGSPQAFEDRQEKVRRKWLSSSR